MLRRWPGPALIAQGLGIVLCCAAVAKFLEGPGSGRISDVGPAVRLVGALVEATVGIALVSRWRPSLVHPSAGMLFILLAGAATMALMRGGVDCGCFGRFSLSPKAMLPFDLAAAAFLLWRPAARAPGSGGLRLALQGGGLTAFFLGIVLGMTHYPPLGRVARALSEASIEAADTVFVEPGQLVGRKCALFRFIKTDCDLSQGTWRLILANPGCSKCEAYLETGGCTVGAGERVLVVVADRAEGWVPPPGCVAPVGRLSPDKRWVFQAPLTLKLTDGRVSGWDDGLAR